GRAVALVKPHLDQDQCQFHLPVCLEKGTYPAHLTDVMDAVPSNQSDLRRGDLVSPVRGTRTRAVREYEQTIEELKKENFDLKLRLFLLEETKNKNYLRNKGSNNEDQDNTVQVIVELKLETEALRTELTTNKQLLQEANEQKEKYVFDLKELQDKFDQLQEELSTVTHHPSEQEIRLLKDENESLQKSNEFYNKIITEKDQEIENINDHLEELSTKNKALEAKVKKSSLAIQGIVSKYYKDIEMIPKEIRPVVQIAVQAAKENRKKDLVNAIENFKTSLSELMSTDGKSYSASKENTPQGKDSMEELQKLAGVSKSMEELTQNQGHSHHRSKLTHDGNKNLDKSSESIHESEKSGKSESREDLDQMLDTFKENENLKQENAEKSKIIDNINAACSELEQRTILLQNELLDAVSKVKNLEIYIKEEKSKQISSLPMKDSSAQTAVQWHLMQFKVSDKFLQNAGHSNNLEDLKEEVLTLLLVIEQKDKEISDFEEQIKTLQSQLDKENKKDVTLANLDKDYIQERSDLHQRLAHSCAINNELIVHLRNLETFMEDLLQHKNLDRSSLENISATSGFLSHLKIQREIEQSLELSTVLNDELSICEGSKIFDPSDASMSKDFSQSYQPVDTSRLSLNNSNIPSAIQGRNNPSQLSLQETPTNAAGTGKRRLSFSTLHNSALDTTLCDSENVVVLGTSNNEDLILLLNEKGDPEDVLIRNNHSYMDKNSSTFENGEQLRRRCWETSAMNYLNIEKAIMEHRTEQWCGSKLEDPNAIIGLAVNLYPSSDSDIWSEPDRGVSLQRIGIDLQKSPVSQKSPRRSRFRDKSTDCVSSQKNESSSSFSKLHTWSKRRKNSDTYKSSFICKKCMGHSQPSDNPSREYKIDGFQKTLDQLSNKCSSQENQFERAVFELRSRKDAIDALIKEKQEMLNYIDQLKEENKSAAVKDSESAEQLSKFNIENMKLQNLIKEFESRMIHSEAIYNQIKEELEKNKTQLNILDSKCKEYEHELSMHYNSKNDYTQKLKEVENEKTNLLDEIESLIVEKNELLSIIEVEKGGKHHFEKENQVLKIKLEEKFKEISLLKEASRDLELVKNELVKARQTIKELLSNIEAEKENRYHFEKENQTLKRRLEENSKEVSLLRASSQDLEHIKSELLKERQMIKELLSKIEIEKENRQHFEKENHALKKKLEENLKEISLLKTSSENLENMKNDILKEKEKSESDLQSSHSMCNELKNDLKKIRECLEKTESRCVKYETELNKSLQSKQFIVESLSNVKEKAFTNLHFLTNVCKQYLDKDFENIINKDSLLSIKDMPDQIRNLFEDIIITHVKFEVLLKSLNEQLSSIQSLKEKSKIEDEENESKIFKLQNLFDEKEKEINLIKMQNLNLQQEIQENKENESKFKLMQHKLDMTENELNILNERKRQMEAIVGELQQTLRNKEKSLEDLSLKNSISEKQLDGIKDVAQKYQNLLNLKDDEITKLQERIFNLQTHVNSLLTNKANSSAGQMNSFSKDNFKESLSSSQLSNANNASISRDSSFSSIASEKDDDMYKKVERYAKKIKALQTKLSMTEKRIEILEKEKADLREELLAQVQIDKTKTKPSEELEALSKELLELKSALKTKTSFIKDLKTELFKTCNSLVDKQKEVDELQYKLSASKSNVEVKSPSSTHSEFRLQYSDPIHKSVETNIKELKNHKWELIQGILKQQKLFYERKNIHLGHFEKFKNHIEKLRSLQVSPTLYKSGSEPLLNTPVVANSFYAEKCDKTLKNLQIELQLDVECLQNLKIFLKRFFIPLVLQNCSCTPSNPKHDDDDNSKQSKQIANDMKDLKKELKLDLSKSSSVEVLRSASASSSSDRLIGTASVVAHNLESIENALSKVKPVLEQFKENNSLIGETPKKTAAKSLLLKILKEITSLEENSEIFHLNSVLKSLGLFDIHIPQSPCKLDMSDRESLLSEETIALSRSGSLSPMSFEENFPSKLFTSGVKQRRESEGYGKNESGKQSLSISQKLALGGSQDSLFLRSHFSSPDLGIESDPNHESSAPEQPEKDFRDGSTRMSKRHDKGWVVEKQLPGSSYSFTDTSINIKEVSSAIGDALYAIGYLQEYELLKKEVQESLVGIKTVLSRTGDGLQHIAKFTSPQKNLEYSTFKAIRDACGNIEVCLQKAIKLVDNFWVAPCPSIKELNILIQQNQDQQQKLKILQESKRKQEINFKEIMEKLKQAERQRENMEKKISKKLVKTKKVIRQAEFKILEKENQDFQAIPKYPVDEYTCQSRS
ncbi:cnn_1N domain-containing protein, partial [Nephila pilipes]